MTTRFRLELPVADPAREHADAPAVVGTIEPTTMRSLNRAVEVRETWIEIYHLPEMELVTAIEILSPSNKGGSGRADYLAKRDALIDQPVNLVEVDLLLRVCSQRDEIHAGPV